jgi:hypothetical protein
MSHAPRMQYLDPFDLQDLLHRPAHEIRSLLELDEADEFPEFLATLSIRAGGYPTRRRNCASLAILMEAL